MREGEIEKREAAVVAHEKELAAEAATVKKRQVALIDDPVRYGLVASLNRPGGNITGAVFFNVALVGKRPELLRDLVPAAASVAFVVDPNNPETEHETRDLQAAVRALALRFDVLSPKDEDEFETAFAKLAQQRTDAPHLCGPNSTLGGLLLFVC
jgi:putative ABC transport system substrate-binding protein